MKIDRDTGVNLITVQENWKDTWRIALGGNYHYNDQWTARMGMAYEQTPVSDTCRTARIPDQDRVWLSFGGQYKPGKDSAIDLAYTPFATHKSATCRTPPARPMATWSGHTVPLPPTS